MAMSPEVRAEYETILKRIVLKYGSVVDRAADIFGWQDYGLTTHARKCMITAQGEIHEDVWNEFMGTFYEGDTSVHGMLVTAVDCTCGQIKHRKMRWSASVQEIAEAVFTELYEERHSTERWEIGMRTKGGWLSFKLGFKSRAAAEEYRREHRMDDCVVAQSEDDE